LICYVHFDPLYYAHFGRPIQIDTTAWKYVGLKRDAHIKYKGTILNAIGLR